MTFLYRVLDAEKNICYTIFSLDYFLYIFFYLCAITFLQKYIVEHIFYINRRIEIRNVNLKFIMYYCIYVELIL